MAGQLRLLLIGAFSCTFVHLHCSKLHGELVTIRFQGIVTSVKVQLANILLPDVDWPDVGSSFQGTYRYESNAPNTSSNPTIANYTTYRPDGPVAVELDGFSLGWNQTRILIAETATDGDRYRVGPWLGFELISPPALQPVLDRNFFQLQLRGDENFLNGLDLSEKPPDLLQAVERSMTLVFDNGVNLSPIPYATVEGTLESLTVVPEVATQALLGMGGILVSARRYRRAIT